MKYYESITIAFLIVFLVFASVAVERLTQIKTDARLTREAMQQLRDDAKTYNEWVQRVTAPAAVCK
jgi:hypothetical protein